MAKASVIYRWADGDSVCLEVEADTSYPDALAEVKATVLAMYRDVMSQMPDAEGG